MWNIYKKQRKNKKFKETGNSRHVYENELNKAFFQHDMANWLFKDLTRRTASDKILRDKGFDIANNPKYYEYQRGLASMVYKFFDENHRLEPLHLQMNLQSKKKSGLIKN